jgi:hypothetical protein
MIAIPWLERRRWQDAQYASVLSNPNSLSANPTTPYADTSSIEIVWSIGS